LFPFGELVKPKIYQNLVWITRKFDLLGGCLAGVAPVEAYK